MISCVDGTKWNEANSHPLWSCRYNEHIASPSTCQNTESREMNCKQEKQVEENLWVSQPYQQFSIPPGHHVRRSELRLSCRFQFPSRTVQCLIQLFVCVHLIGDHLHSIWMICQSNSDFVPLFSDKFPLSNEEVERRVRPKFDYYLVENSLSVYFFWNSILSGTALRFLFHLPSAYQNRKFVSFGSELRSNTNTIDPMSQLHWDWVVAVKVREFANPSGNWAMVVQFMHKHLGLV